MKGILILAALAAFGFHSLAQVAPTEANLRAAAASGGVTKFSADGTIKLSTHVSFSADTTLDADGHTVIIDGQNLTRLFEVNAPAHLTLKGLTLANGLYKGLDRAVTGGAGQSVAGGAIRNLGGSVTVQSCTFSNNNAAGGSGTGGIFEPFWASLNGGSASGGAIFQTAGTLTIHGSTFVNNFARAGAGSGPAPAFGGAICVLAGSVFIDGTSTFATNGAVAGSNNGLHGNAEAHGGAIYLESGTLEINGAKFFANVTDGVANAAAFGGAIALKNGALQVTDTFFRDNQSLGGAGMSYRSGIGNMPGGQAYGGAINVSSNANAIVRSSTFLSNSATGGPKQYNAFASNGGSYGGAVAVEGTANVANSTFVANALLSRTYVGDFGSIDAPQLGGALYNSGSLGVDFSTISGNSSRGPILASEAGTFTLKNSLLDWNSVINAGPEIVDGGYNLSATGTPAFTQASSHNNVDLKLRTLGDYGGPTPTMPLMLGSPAIDAAGNGPIPLADQRGRARPYGPLADLGAFESSPPFYVFGKIEGYLSNSMTVTHSATSLPVGTNGEFQFIVPAGANSFSFAGTNSVFRPNPLLFQVNADMETEARSFAFSALAYDPDLSAPAFTLGGKAGETWELQLSHDLIQWSPIQTNTFTADGISSVLLTNMPFPAFVKAVRK